MCYVSLKLIIKGSDSYLRQNLFTINEEYGHVCEDFIIVRDDHVLTPASIDAQIKHGCKHIGLPLKSMHKTRKTYASTLLHNGVNLSIVKDMLGHADEATTMAHYIFNTENSESTDLTVLNALEVIPAKQVTQSDTSSNQIIRSKSKKSRNHKGFGNLLGTAGKGT